MKGCGLIIGLLFSFSLCGQITKKADQLFDKGIYYQALHKYCDLIVNYPGQLDQAFVAFRAGVCCLRMNCYTEALEWFVRAEKDGCLQKELFWNFGDLYLSMGEYAKANSYFQRYREISPDDERLVNKILSCQFGQTAPTENSKMKVKALPYVNTRGSEYGISLVSGGMLYSSTGDLLPEKQGEIAQRTGMGYSKPYLSLMRNGVYQPGQQLKGIQKTGANEGSFAYDAANEQLYCARCEQGVEDCYIVLAQLKDSKYKEIGKLKLGKKTYNIAHPFVEEGGGRIYFSSTMEGGYGGADIWYVTRTAKGTWGTPRNAGAMVNTPGNEVFPYIWRDTFYFASDGHVGYGGLDLYKSPLWSIETEQPQNMGPGFNSSYDDFNMVIARNGKTGLFVSNRVLGRSDDIFSFEICESINTQSAKPEKTDIDISGISQGWRNSPIQTLMIDETSEEARQTQQQTNLNETIVLKDEGEGSEQTYDLGIRTGELEDAGWWIQVAMLKESGIIEYGFAAKVTELTGRRIVMYKGKDGGHRFYIGIYENELAARKEVNSLKEAGVDCFIKRVTAQ